MNRAIDHVVRHLAEPLPLHAVAQAARLSPFHFHRVFRAVSGETLNQFVTRLRLERSLSLRLRHRRCTLTEVALACGFSSPSDYTRCFKQRYGVPPSAFDLAAHRDRQRRALEGALPPEDGSHARLDRLAPGANPDGFAVRLRALPARTLAYLRVRDSYREGVVPEAARRLQAWADGRGLGGGQWLGYMWDDPEVVALDDCRYDVAVTVPDDTATGGEVGRCRFPAVLVAELELRGGIDLEMRALDWLYGSWLPASGFVPADQPCFEAWMGRPFAHGLEHFELRVWLPVQRGRGRKG